MVTVGIDPHKQTHTAVVVDGSGRRRGRALTVPDEVDAVARLLVWAGRHAGGQRVIFAIEDGRGLARRLADGLLAAGQQVCWVPVRLVVGARRAAGPRGKSDPIDALAVAKAAGNSDNAGLLTWHRLAEPGRELRLLTDERAALVAERTRLINRMRWRLHELGIQPPTDLTGATAPQRLIETLTHTPTSHPGDPQGSVAGLAIELLLESCHDLHRLTSRITALTQQMDQRTTRDYPTLRALPGVGPVTAATLAGEVGDPARIHSSPAFARLNGTAPIPVWTSNTERHRLDRGGNRKLNHALHTIALTQARSHPAARALIAKHQPHKGKRGARRILKRHLSDVIYRALHTDITTHTPLTSTNTAA